MAGGSIPANLAPIFKAAGAQYNIPAAVLAGISSVESNLGRNDGPSSTGAIGLMQFEPGTARSLGVNPNDPRSAIFGTAKYLSQLGYHQNPTRAIGAYNGGPGNPQYGYARQVLSEASRLGGQLGGGGALAASPMGASPSGGALSVTFPQTVQSFDQAGFDAAKARYIAGTALHEASSGANPYNTVPGTSKGLSSALAQSGGNPLFSDGLLTTKAPNPGDFITTKTQDQTLQFATGRLQQLAGVPLTNVHGGAAGDTNPIPGAVIGRTDMGVDANLKPGAAIVAPNNGRVVAIVPNWYKGQPYIAVQLTSGPNAGKVLYVAEQVTPGVRVGQTIRKGAPIGRYASSGTGIEIGWANPRNPTQTLAQGTTGYTEGQQTQAGQNFRSYLSGVGA